ncbi:Uncharacterised protein [Klebsiella pneumoniae]|jgi:hypothetical protein|nr:hypothetical protein SM58_04857 [Klebsiella pneumoniae]CAI2040075.1 Uncharacterised protein [Serratia marcescens]SAE71202.1 Uncharacterised protein [Enterobacter hormaechei]SAH50263.1 Uncharacterised protein [Enterobacter hormaechei]SAI15112.1 Uncharacterised protein [Enterobacter hormaechei]
MTGSKDNKFNFFIALTLHLIMETISNQFVRIAPDFLMEKMNSATVE